jgi:ABC-type multidrug transport system fused ATPase/permease subunit
MWRVAEAAGSSLPLQGLRSSAEWRFLGALFHADRGLATVWWALVILRGALPAAFTLSVGALVGAVQHGQQVAPALALTGAVFMAMNALVPVHDAVGADLGARAGAWLHDGLVGACVSPPGINHLERSDLADRLARVRDFDLGLTAPSLAVALPRVGSGFVGVAGGLAQAALLTAYAWWAPLILVAAWTSTHVLLKDSSSWKAFGSEPVARERRYADYAYRLAVDAPAAKEVRLFGLGGWMVDQIASRRSRLVEVILHEQRLRRGPIRWGLALIVVANALVFWSLARDAAAGSLSLTALVVFAQAAIGVSALASGDFDWWFRGSAQPVPTLLDLEAPMASEGGLPQGHRDPGGRPRQEIRFDDVSFTYDAATSPVLDGFNLAIPAGTSLAIVGPNGAGKTTIAKLLCRLYDPQRGALLVDGVDLRDYDLEAWRARLSAVFQDFVRYELSLAHNVAPAGAPDQEVLQALEMAGATGLAAVDTVLSRAFEGGTELSGGQWQRVALARALCAVRLGAGVVILDEPTAQLDVRGEAEIFDRILKATGGLTTILISHRFSTVRHADRICVLEGGRVVELGSHAQLMRRKGRYRSMFELQAARFVAGVEEADAEKL